LAVNSSTFSKVIASFEKRLDIFSMSFRMRHRLRGQIRMVSELYTRYKKEMKSRSVLLTHGLSAKTILETPYLETPYLEAHPAA
jgi:hypothetical protein